jgi:hypothetical protein
MSMQERISNADAIVVGRATSVDAFAPDRAHPEAGLTEVTLAVENVLRGDAPDHELRFYFYRIVGSFNGPTPNFLKVGDRAIFFLRREQGILRSVHDFWESHTKVYSGRHDAVFPDKEVQKTIAEIVITPGQNFDRGEYLRALQSVEHLGVPARHSVPLLEKLAYDPDPEMAKYACIALSSVFVWGDQCLAQIVAGDPQVDVRAKARTLTQRNVKIRAHEEMELKRAPAVFFSRITYAGSQEARFILERLTKHLDAEVRGKAAELLQQMSAVGY